MKYALGNMLNGYGVRGLDADAKAYINAVVAAGATVTSTQSNAINTFVKTEKAGSRWGLLKRIHLPIWGIAAPNAICMKSLTSGTFVGGVTHGIGYAQGNGVTGYFQASGTGTTMGLSSSSLHIGVLAKTPGTKDTGNMIDFAEETYCTLICSTGSNGIYVAVNEVFDFAPKGTKNTGIFVCDLTGLNRTYAVRDSTGYSVIETNTNARYSELVSGCAITLNAWKGVGLEYGDFQMGAMWAALSMQSELSIFTLNLKTLWETTTGLTLP